MVLNTKRFDFDYKLGSYELQKFLKEVRNFEQSHKVIYKSPKIYISDSWFRFYIIYEEE